MDGKLLWGLSKCEDCGRGTTEWEEGSSEALQATELEPLQTEDKHSHLGICVFAQVTLASFSSSSQV